MPVITQAAGHTQEHVHSHHFATENIGTMVAPVMAEHAHQCDVSMKIQQPMINKDAHLTKIQELEVNKDLLVLHDKEHKLEL